MKNMKIILILVFCFLSVGVQASSGEHHEVTVWTYAFPFINFFILLGVLFYFLKTPIKSMFANRSQNIAQLIRSSQQQHEQTVQAFDEIQNKLKNADDEAKALLKNLKSSAEAEKQNLLNLAQEFSQQLKNETQNLITQEVKKAQITLKTEVVNLSSDLAKAELSKKMTPEIQSRLQNEFISSLKNESKQGVSA